MININCKSNEIPKNYDFQNDSTKWYEIEIVFRKKSVLIWKCK